MVELMIYHGDPMVGIPLLVDQPGNIAHIKARKAAVRLNLNTMSSTDLLNALNYKENAMWLSTIHHDQLLKPLDGAVLWTEFVTRHKGAEHLRPACYNLTCFQDHSLDVIGFLLACVVIATFCVIKCCLFCCQKFKKENKKKTGMNHKEKKETKLRAVLLPDKRHV
ncbi:udp-glucuronosyltransferase 2b21 [Lynx pardinus]|uniref:glucuronosyltransferase n=1 Tax=Lynx pardinus TaxID=191816 RepID=A0A485NRD9_LYNPA|nr:udp-glucuronosyltransferase 2b21 [Lynx pardinus]